METKVKVNNFNLISCQYHQLKSYLEPCKIWRIFITQKMGDFG